MNALRRPRQLRRRAAGLSLVELLVGMALMLVIVTAASVVYLNTREADSAQSRTSETIETGTFALELIGRDLAQAWSYPVVLPPATEYSLNAAANRAPALLLQSFPPVGWTDDTTNAAYRVGVFGCDGGQYNSATGTCVPTTAVSPNRSAPDSVVINYFSSEAARTPIGNRRDCNNADAGNDTLNAVRKFNTVPITLGTVTRPSAENENFPPSEPVFVSNRYGLVATATEIDRQSINTFSLACNGNGANGGAIASNNYQPLLLGVEDLQFTYGVFDLDPTSTSGAIQSTPTQFLTATQVATLPAIVVDGVSYANWNRVVAVRVCVMTRTLGSNARMADKSGQARTYQDCTDDTPRDYEAGDRSIRVRTVKVVAVRNRMNQIY